LARDREVEKKMKLKDLRQRTMQPEAVKPQ
jgi:hypothetical protein